MGSFTFFVLFGSLTTIAFGTGMNCSDHPLYRPGMRGEMIRAWKYADRAERMYWTPGTYIPRSSNYTFAPVDDLTSTKYKGLDYFLTGFNGENTPNFLTIFYQRVGKTYLLIHGGDSSNGDVHLPGWESEGWVKRTSGEPDLRHTFGLGQRKESIVVPYTAYVVSKIGDYVEVPSQSYIKEHITGSAGLRTSGFYSILVAEQNGDPVQKPAIPTDMNYTINVTAGAFCPKELHEKWVTNGTDSTDPQTWNRTFKTWHPLWDPCYWCSYGHEHGSAAPLLMNYKPRYGYTSLKNGNEDESHAGFKDIVMDFPQHWVYYSVHAHMSRSRRFSERHHTQVMAVVNKKTKKLEVELRFKADYGALTVRKVVGGLVGVSDEDEKLRNYFGYKRRHRLINIIDPDNLDRRWRYKPGERLLTGEYEQWATQPMCSTISNGREPTMDFKDAGIALLTDTDITQTTDLGRLKKEGELMLNPSINREFRAKDFLLSAADCALGEEPSGTFYTNPYGTKLRDGPGDNNVRQYMAEGFEMNISGDFETTDPWLGLYKDGAKGEFRNIGLGIDEKAN